MAVSVSRRRLCGTAEAASIYGCSQRHVRMMAARREIWSDKVGDRALVVDADEVRRLAAERQRQRRAGKLRGRHPGGQASA